MRRRTWEIVWRPTAVAATHLAALLDRVERGERVTRASYLELASRLGVPLATLDDRLLSAANEEGVARFAG